MSISAFSDTINSHIFKDWLNKLDKNIISNNVKDIRSSQQVAEKTDFYLSSANIRSIYKNVTNLDLTRAQARSVLKKISEQGSVRGKAVRVGKTSGVFFESIGFDTISTKVKEVFDSLEGVQEAYAAAIDKYTENAYRDIANNPKITKASDIQAARDKVDKYAKNNIGNFGNFIHKGHVVSIATNTAKNFAESIKDYEGFQEEQKKLLLDVLDKYITKLTKDDIASSNLAKYAGAQEIYAKYLKSPSKYLVELQFSTGNMESGNASLPIVQELRKLFTISNQETKDILTKSDTLGKALLNTKGSPSYIDLLAENLVETLTGKKVSTKVYSISPTLVAKRDAKVSVRKNTEDISKLKQLKAKIQATKKLPAIRTTQGQFYSLASLQVLINSQLQDVISANMGDGSSRNVLNYRTGRFAASASVERMSQSREGMITAFYSYMKNPYQTFEPGFRQGSPKTRDPKLLIATSIRDIAANKVGNRLRAVLI